MINKPVKLTTVCLALLVSLCFVAASDAQQQLELREGQRIALIGNSTAERMNLFGNFETKLHARFSDKKLIVRNFGWPADEVGKQQRPGNYTKIDDPLKVFGPDMFICFFGFNESYAGTDENSVADFTNKYRAWIEKHAKEFAKDGKAPKFVLVSPIAFESTGNPLQPSGENENKRLKVYSKAVAKLAEETGLPFVDLFEPTQTTFDEQPGNQFTINGVHANELGDQRIARALDRQLFGNSNPVSEDDPHYEKLRAAVNDKSWYHLQDYRMLNGWYVYGGRRTWDTKTFPGEYVKIRKMVAVRDNYVHDIAAGKKVADSPNDSLTGDVFVPDTMFGTRDDNFRKMREPKTLEYPTPEESIKQMSMPDDFEVKLFASEREFPEMANPTQLNFDNKGRLWVSCMVTYPQWMPGASKPGDHLLILEDTDGDGKADVCKKFYDKLICPTGFEFWNGGVLVVDEPRILFLKDTDGDDVADEVIQLLDGIGTDDTHHTMGAWEFSHGGLLHMQEGVAISTTLETPWGPFRNQGPSGSYVWDLHTLKMRHFRTPGYGNPWCLVFDKWGNTIIGDGTSSQHHWGTPLSGKAVNSRKTLQPIFNNEGMRPSVGNDYLTSRHFPDEMHDQFIYACVINMHGMPRFNIRDEEDGAGLIGERIEDLLSSTDMFFRPVDPRIGPDGALWFGDWCNALIGHMQYSQRDPNRDHEHGRVYRMVYKKKPLLEPITQAEKSIAELLEQLKIYEPRTRYAARRELRDRNKDRVFAAIEKWIEGVTAPNQLCEAMWLQESFRDLNAALLDRILETDSAQARAAAMHSIGNEHDRVAGLLEYLKRGIADPHPRVRCEAVRGLSYVESAEAAEIALTVHEKPVDYWIEYTLEHTLQALQPYWSQAEKDGKFLVDASESTKMSFNEFKYASGPGKAIYKPLHLVENTEISQKERDNALSQLVNAEGGDLKRGEAVFGRVCANCHKFGEVGKEFGPSLTDVTQRLNRREIIKSIVWPNDTISKGFETIAVETLDGKSHSGFVIEKTDEAITLGIADGKTIVIPDDDIEDTFEMKASSMPEGLVKTIAPIEFLDLLKYLQQGWIETAGDQSKLRRKNGFEEISRDAKLKLGPGFPDVWNGQANLLLSSAPSPKTEFVIHSPDSGSNKNTTVVVALAQPSEIRNVWMENRRDKQFHARAKGLAIWVSDDEKQWKQVWKSTKPQPQWDVSLPEGTTAKYIKIGLHGTGTFHLNRVAIFGRKLELPKDGQQ